MRILLITGALAGLLSFSSALAQTPIPGIPATFYGSASIDGQPVPDGTEVRAFVGDIDCSPDEPATTATVGGVSTYVIGVLAAADRVGCGEDGSAVTFTIGGQEAAQSGTWSAAPIELNLNAGTGQPLPLPTFTPVPEPTFGPSPTPGGDASGEETSEGVTSSATVEADSDEGEDDDGGPSWLLWTVVLGGLAVAGVGGAMYLARRNRT